MSPPVQTEVVTAAFVVAVTVPALAALLTVIFVTAVVAIQAPLVTIALYHVSAIKLVTVNWFPTIPVVTEAHVGVKEFRKSKYQFFTT